ncbi:unnamed protein product [Cyclocybe aegerita]|uniref:Uncharacterized protein n=1 Tax=Cyclocybe aegerita TaxID=1973307 RepID=A0A8S0VUH8_CYCAE|nr:unnamed protein product [Cyclocybe aegerita]
MNGFVGWLERPHRPNKGPSLLPHHVDKLGEANAGRTGLTRRKGSGLKLKAQHAIQEFYQHWRDAEETDLQSEIDVNAFRNEANVPSRLFVRSAYISLFERSEARFRNSGAVITGAPGAGKTIFLRYALSFICSMVEKRSYRSSGLSLTMIAISLPTLELRSLPTVFPVQAASPNPVRYGLWAKRRRLAPMWGLELWDEE